MISTQISKENKKVIKEILGVNTFIIVHDLAERLDMSIAEVHNIMNRKGNIKRFIPIEDYINILDYPELTELSVLLKTSNNTKQITVFTDKGGLKLLTMIGGDKAWELWDKVNNHIKKNKDTKIEELTKKLRWYNPPIEDYNVVNVSPFSSNYILKWSYEAKKLVTSYPYSQWKKNFPVSELVDLSHIDWDKKVYIWLMYDCMDKFDSSNLSKAVIDRVCSYLGVDDGNVELMSGKVNKYVSGYKDSKIYYIIKNAEDDGNGN